MKKPKKNLKGDTESANQLDEPRLLNLLTISFNPHWSAGELPEYMVENFRRRDFFTLKKEIENNMITLITGPRQVGKTTIIFQLMDHLLKNGVEPKRILYLQMDDNSLQNVTDETLDDSLSVYSKYILKTPLNKLTETVYVFLDEIQYLENWSQIIKSVYDRRYKIKFFLSGSSSTEIYEASNPLQGRLTKRIISTLKFSDFVCFHLQEEREKILEFSLGVRDEIRDAIITGNVKELYGSIMEKRAEIADIEDDLKIRFNDYLIRGGYPRLLRTTTYSEASKFLKDSLDLSILDIVKRYEIRNPKYFENILYLLSDATSKNVSYSSISKNLGIDKVTVAEYIEYLKRTYIISVSRFFSTSSAKRVRKDYKIHVNDVGLRNAVVSSLNESLLNDRTELGKVLETCIYNHAQRLQFYLSGHDNIDVGYTEIRKNEIDIIINFDKHILPIEVKLLGTRPHDETAINDFMKEHDLKFGIIITEKTLKMHNNILLLPAWLFTLCC